MCPDINPTEKLPGTTSQRVSVVWVEVSRRPLFNGLGPFLLRHRLPLPVLVPQVEVQRGVSKDSKHDGCKRTAQSHDILSVLCCLEYLAHLSSMISFCAIRIMSKVGNHHNACRVSNGLVHSYSHGSLVVRCVTVQKPGAVQPDNHVNARSDEKG